MKIKALLESVYITINGKKINLNNKNDKNEKKKKKKIKKGKKRK